MSSRRSFPSSLSLLLPQPGIPFSRLSDLSWHSQDVNQNKTQESHNKHRRGYFNSQTRCVLQPSPAASCIRTEDSLASCEGCVERMAPRHAKEKGKFTCSLLLLPWIYKMLQHQYHYKTVSSRNQSNEKFPRTPLAPPPKSKWKWRKKSSKASLPHKC